MKNEKIVRKLGAIALTGIISSTTMLPCVVNASETVKEDNTQVVSSESVAKNGKAKRKIKKQAVKNSGDTVKKEKLENLADEEKEALKVKKEKKKAEKKVERKEMKDGSQAKAKRQKKAKKIDTNVTAE